MRQEVGGKAAGCPPARDGLPPFPAGAPDAAMLCLLLRPGGVAMACRHCPLALASISEEMSWLSPALAGCPQGASILANQVLRGAAREGSGPAR